MIRVAIVEDEDIAARQLEQCLQQYESGHDIRFSSCRFRDALEFLEQYQPLYDLIFMDIGMPGLDGMEAAVRLRAMDSVTPLIFVTSMVQYAVRGYEVDALHYLMKPVKPEKLFSVLDRAAEKLSKNEKVLNLELDGALLRLPVYQIRYADVRGNYVTIHAKEHYTVKKTLSDLLQGLDDRFYRVGRSAVVNLTCISRVTKTEIVLRDGSSIPLPRGAYEKLNRAIINMG